MTMFLTRAKKWIVPGFTICVLCALNFLFSSYFLSKDCLKDFKMVSMRPKENYTEPIASTQAAIERYNKRIGITIAFTVCGDITRLEQALVMLKSAVMFSRSKLDVHIFADNHLQMEFRNKLSRWPQQFLKNLSYHIHNISFPDDVVSLDNDKRGWRDMFRPCATQRLFFPSLLAEVDALIYVDTDTLFLSPLEDLWNYFYHFNSSHEMAASLAREYVDTKILMKDGIPVLRKDEINSGVMLFNLTRMRSSTFNESIYQYRKKYGSLLRGDQAILSIYRYNYPDRMDCLPCEWNYRAAYCEAKATEQKCLEAEETGVRLLHGTSYRFMKENVTSMFQAVYKAFEQFDLGYNVLSDLILSVDASSDQITDRKCGKKSIFMKQIYERSKLALTKDIK